MKLLLAVIAAVTLSLLAFVTVKADRATSTSFTIESGVIDAGGERTTSTGFNLRSSLAQPGTGISTSTSFILKGGFLYFPVPVVPAPPPAPAPAPTPLGGGGLLFPRPPLPPEEILKLCDFNDDGRCNLIDLSILLFYWERRGPAVARYDLNSNGQVDFIDISVLMYYWSG